MPEYKIIFSGPVGSGKTTAIRTVSDIEVVCTEEVATDEASKLKPNTTVAMDYGVIKIDETDRMHLFGTPGQERFRFMWDILTEGGSGLILLISNTLDNPQEQLDYFLTAFKDFIQETRVVVGITHTELPPSFELASFQEVLAKHEINTAVFEVDARSKKDISYLIEALICSKCSNIKFSPT